MKTIQQFDIYGHTIKASKGTRNSGILEAVDKFLCAMWFFCSTILESWFLLSMKCSLKIDNLIALILILNTVLPWHVWFSLKSFLFICFFTILWWKKVSDTLIHAKCYWDIAVSAYCIYKRTHLSQISKYFID